ncbi:hypothetical protein D043_1685A, partial [Vibrio parahaemolyticus EKP-021]
MDNGGLASIIFICKCTG